MFLLHTTLQVILDVSVCHGTFQQQSASVLLTQVIGWENIELISDRPLETMLDEFKRLKHEFPDRYIGSTDLSQSLS